MGLDLRVFREMDTAPFRQWEERVNDRLPTIATGVEQYASMPLLGSLEVRLVAKRTCRREHRAWVLKALEQAGALGQSGLATPAVRSLLARAMSRFAAAAAAAEVRDHGPGKPVTLSIQPDRHNRTWLQPAPEWYWDHVLCHELTHVAQAAAASWTRGESLERQWAATGATDPADLSALEEGHADWVAQRWMAEAHPGCDESTLRFGARTRTRLLRTLLRPVVGAKAAGYTEGRAFAEAVYAHGGHELLHRAWAGLDNVPTRTEIREPERWIKRMGGR
ncbi:zinc-dependent metalloprotease [Streptomyces sp. NPDC060243]|uniref:zinc-dependent metalloprotease n=1 Tax=Streptomyces sp. NPDC060243 TaxID=3347081 RepID=UPI0036599964